jgi:hypothetical protein
MRENDPWDAMINNSSKPRMLTPDELNIPAGYLFEAIAGKMEFCQNPVCPNNHFIGVMAFRGTGVCSDDCRKAIGQGPPEVDARH